MTARHSLAVIALLTAAPLAAATPSVTPGSLECLPNEHNAVLTARVDPDVGGASVRLYFRRLNPVGAFYYDEMLTSASGEYWTVFPRPEDRQQHLLSDDWWEILKDREWMAGHDREWLKEWLEKQEEEAAEYYVAVYDASGKLLARSETRLVEVWQPEDCPVTLDRRQAGWAGNLTVGETTAVQASRCLFHWLCDGVVTRIDWEGVLQPDDCCRACVIAGLWPLAGGGVLIAGPPLQEASPQQP